jgi:monovalent cation:H+ antiporter-2, CPA2 family
MHDLDLILTLAGGLTSALIAGYLTQRIGLSPIVGYLMAGVLVGPYTPGFVADPGSAEQLAEVGVILIMFGVGLQFHVEELLAVRRVAVPGAIAQSLVATALGFLVARALGWEGAAAVVFGLALSVASTVVLVRVLVDNNDLHTPTGHIAVGWLVVEDLFTVIVLVLLPSLSASGGGPSNLGVSLAVTALKVAGLVAFTFVVGTKAIPWLLDRVAATRSRELFTLTVLVIALGIAVGSALLAGVSMALGAFLAGLVVGRSEFSLRAAAEALPMRDAFAVLFFVSVGMLLNPASLLEAPLFIAAALAIVLVGKPLIALLVVIVLRYSLKVALAVAVALAQIGEFSFILVAVSRDLELVPATAMDAVVAVAIVSIVLNPILYRLVGPAERWISARPRLWRVLNAGAAAPGLPASARPASFDSSHHAVVVGYGPSGRILTRLLRENEIEPTVIELNVDTVRRLREGGISAVYGDASQRDILEAAGVDRATSLILSAAGMAGIEEVIRQARDINPAVHILARTAYLQDVEALKKAGADDVFSGEREVALALTEAILDRLGATPEQIDRERARVHAELTPKV